MDPITTAIITAVSAGITDIGKKAFYDAYQGLKGLIKSRYGQDNKILKAIADLEENPASKGRRMILAEIMVQEKADQDSELMSFARQLIQEFKETEQGRQAMAKYQVDARGSQIGVVGDEAKVEGGIHFGDSKR
jgi:hypothetical protein